MFIAARNHFNNEILVISMGTFGLSFNFYGHGHRFKELFWYSKRIHSYHLPPAIIYQKYVKIENNVIFVMMSISHEGGVRIPCPISHRKKVTFSCEFYSDKVPVEQKSVYHRNSTLFTISFSRNFPSISPMNNWT